VSEAITIEDLCCCYPNGTKAVDCLSLSVSRGEIFGLLGVNGAGKSTIIKALTTLMRPTTGRVSVLGYDTQSSSVEIKRRIGVIPQENNLDISLDVRQNLLFHCRYAGMKKDSYRDRVEAWMETLGLGEKAGELILHLSGGTKRKVMLAKAFLTGPELLIMDEPTSGLDPEVRSVIWQRIREFRDAGKTVFLSTHYMDEAERLCDRIGIIQKGRLMAIGRTEELRERVGDCEAGMEELFHIYAGKGGVE
jgi:ABC-type multidrug transport system ATPase subunit